MKIAGAVIIVISSIAIGFFLSDSLKTRLKNISALIIFVEYVSANIQMYRTPLEEIFRSFSDVYLDEKGFSRYLKDGVGVAAKESNILCGDEEKEIIGSFDEKIGCGTAEEMDKLCEFTLVRLRNLEDKLYKELPDKQKVYRTISVLTGISVVIMLI